MPASVTDALRDYDDRAADVSSAGHKTFDDSLARFVRLFEPTQPLGVVVSEKLPLAPDFDSWFSQCAATGGSMVGSADLTWPLDDDERLSLQLELMRRIATGKPHVFQFTNTFMYGGTQFDGKVQKFISELFRPFARDLRKLLARDLPAPAAVVLEAGARVFINDARIAELSALGSSDFDLSRLLRLCEELNLAFASGCYHATAMLTRALLDHVPPIFGQPSFAAIANNHGGGGRSFRELMLSLDASARKIADAHLHLRIRSSEALPNSTQVDFSQATDALLGEIIRLLK